MNYIGDFPEDFTTVTVLFSTHDGNGAPVAPSDAFEAADVKIYKNGNAAQKTTTNGLTMTSPFDSITGLHCLVIDTSVDTGDVGFWVAGATYSVVLNPDSETVNSQSVLKVIGTFGLALAPVFARLGAPAGASVSADIATVAGYVDTEVAAIKAKTDNLPSDPADASDIAASFSTVNSTLATIAGYVDTEVAAIKAKTDQLTFTVANQVDVNVVDWKGAAAPAMTGDAYARLGAPAGASVSADIAALQADTDDIQSRLPAVLVGGRIDASVGAMAANVMTAAAAAADLTTELQTGLATASAMSALQTSVDDLPTNAELATALAGADDAVLAQVALVKAKTDNLPGDPADASDIAASFSTVNSTLATIAGYVDTEVAAIKAKTDQITFTVTGQVDANIQSVNDLAVSGSGTSGDPWGPA